jgi:hypothetical protein
LDPGKSYLVNTSFGLAEVHTPPMAVDGVMIFISTIVLPLLQYLQLVENLVGFDFNDSPFFVKI